MRLINIYTLELEEFFESEIPPYCILSHRWKGKETTYKDFSKGRNKYSPGYRKIIDFCTFLREQQLILRSVFSIEQESRRYETRGTPDDLQWAWVDTCEHLMPAFGVF